MNVIPIPLYIHPATLEIFTFISTIKVLTLASVGCSEISRTEAVARSVTAASEGQGGPRRKQRGIMCTDWWLCNMNGANRGIEGQ